MGDFGGRNDFGDDFGEELPSDFVEVDGEIVPVSELDGLERRIAEIDAERLRDSGFLVDEVIDNWIEEDKFRRKGGGGSGD